MFFWCSSWMAAVAVFVGWSLFCHSMPSRYPKLDEKRMRHTRELWIDLEKDCSGICGYSEFFHLLGLFALWSNLFIRIAAFVHLWLVDFVWVRWAWHQNMVPLVTVATSHWLKVMMQWKRQNFPKMNTHKTECVGEGPYWNLLLLEPQGICQYLPFLLSLFHLCSAMLLAIMMEEGECGDWNV